MLDGWAGDSLISLWFFALRSIGDDIWALQSAGWRQFRIGNSLISVPWIVQHSSQANKTFCKFLAQVTSPAGWEPKDPAGWMRIGNARTCEHEQLKHHRDLTQGCLIFCLLYWNWQVSALYRDASIGNAINIVMVRLMLLENESLEVSKKIHTRTTTTTTTRGV